MLLKLQDGGDLIEAKFGRRRILSDKHEIDAFRAQVDQSDDLTTLLPRFVTRATLAGELPVTLLMYRSGVLYGVALLCFRRKLGLPSGVVAAGDRTGQGGVIAKVADRIPVLETASRVLMRIPLIHTVILSALWPEPVRPDSDQPASGTGGHWHFRDAGFRLDLRGGQNATMERLGYKMRRNLGYYRRRAEAQLGCRFVPELRPEQRLQAVDALSDKGTYRIGIQNARKLEATLLAMPGHFAMGMQDAQGAWLSYIAGWRGKDGTYIDWQLNREYPVNASISTVMRSYMLDQELERGSPEIIFVGGTAPNWSRACLPAICGDLLVVRRGLLGGISRRLARRFNPSGHLAKLQGRLVP